MPSKDSTFQHDIVRGRKERNVAGIATFFIARLADPFVQYGFLKREWGAPLIHQLRGTTLPSGPPVITNSFLDRLGLSPYRSILFAMSIGSMVKQNYHTGVIMQETMAPSFALMVGAFNMLGNSINSLLFVCAQTSASVNGEHFPQTPLIVGTTMYVTGLLIEWLSEQQRYNWKKAPANKGKVYGGGLFGFARHINYFGYTLWRSGYAIAAGGWTWGAVTAALATIGFTQRTIPEHQQYMEEKYGAQYQEYARRTPYKLVPGIW